MSNRQRYILCCVDYHSNYVIAMTTTTTNSEEVIRELYNKVFMIYGIPKYLQSDNASCFTSNSFKQFLASHNVHHTLTSPYMPTSNGRIERTNQSVLNLLRCLATDNPDKWTEYLPAVCNTLNNAYNATTKTSPNIMIFGKQTRTAFDIDLSNTTPYSEHLQNLLELQQNKHGRIEITIISKIKLTMTKM